MADVQAIEAEVERNYRHNFIVNFFDATLFWGGSSFIAVRTILPLFASHFTDNELLIGLIPAIASGGWLIPQIFTANWVRRLPRKKVLPVNVGIFSERLPILLMALAAWLVPASNPTLSLALLFLFIAWHTFGAGLIAVAWQDMIAKIFPLEKRGRFMGLSSFSGTVFGIFGASISSWLLNNYEFPKGYAISFTLGGVLIFASWFFLALTREPALVREEQPVSQREYWKSLPGILRSNRNFTRYLLSQAIWALSMMASGFVAIYAVQRWSLPDSYAGYFTAALLVGQSVGNLVFGYMADRAGHKIVLELSALFGALGYGLAVVAPSPIWFFFIFALTGSTSGGLMVSGIAIAFEFCEPEERPTYIGLNNTIYGITAVVAPLIGGWLAVIAGYQVLFMVSFLTGIAAAAIIRWYVKEPRLDYISVAGKAVPEVMPKLDY
jgi:MFS family permease